MTEQQEIKITINITHEDMKFEFPDSMSFVEAMGWLQYAIHTLNMLIDEKREKQCMEVT
jgi:hypothetical protein